MMIKDDRIYDVLKFLGRLLIPGLATLYVALANIWGWPYAEAVAGSAAAVVTFLNAVLEYSNMKYNQAVEDAFVFNLEEEDEEEKNE